MFLTIAIPTYQRPMQLRRTVTALLPQLAPDVELIILDNHSPMPARDQLCGLDDRFTIIRHSGNIGGNANIVRCLEQGSGKWIWILSDDDFVLPDAVQSIRRVLENEARDCGFVNFASELCNRQSDIRLESIDDLLTRCDSFFNLLFISAGVFRRNCIHPLLTAAHVSIPSFAPQFAVVLLIQRMGIPTLLSATRAIKWEYPPEGAAWEAHHRLNFFDVCELLSTHDEQHRLALIIEHSAIAINQRELIVRAFASQFHNPRDPSPLLFIAKRAAALGLMLLPTWRGVCWLLTACICAGMHMGQPAVVVLWNFSRLVSRKEKPTPKSFDHKLDFQSLRLPAPPHSTSV